MARERRESHAAATKGSDRTPIDSQLTRNGHNSDERETEEGLSLSCR